MFTQCPECGVAFRVTPEVLKIAAGKVRCGGCGVPFNALEHLSESKPIAHPEPQESAESESHEPSADESSSLLQALDELGGEDVRIEDTGVEWRVVDDGDTNWDDDNEGQPEDSEQPDSEPPRAIDEMLFDDNTVLPDDFDAFLEAPSTSGPSEPLAFEESEPEPPPVDLDLSEPDEWDELLGDLEVLPSEDETDLEPEPESEPESEPEPEPEPGEEPEPEPEPEPEEEPEVTALEAESLSESHDNVDEDELERSIEEDLLAAAFESEAAARTLTGDSIDEIPDEADDVEDEDDDLSEEEVEIDIQIDDDLEPEDDVEDIANPFDDTIEETIATLSMSLNEDPFNDDIEEEPQADAELAEEESETEKESESGEHVIPEMTEEEKTINMLIDQDLFNIAVEDEDGFASTIVQLQPDDKVEKEIADKDSRSKKSGKKDKKDSAKDTDSDEAAEAAAGEPALPGMGVETIIMEGEFVHGGDNEVPLALNREKDDYELRRELDGQNPRIGMYVGLAALVLVLLVQVIHQSRDALATVPAFNSAVGPVYRMLGMPLTPAWDISAWRFEATKGDTDESGEVLTIYSRVGNNSDESLPYPLVHLSLTDRFEDIIGSTVLDPADYLPENSDPRTLVPPGNTFNAVIVIDSPSSDATGFKLNVCYRLASGQLRCADHDFK